jgi:hypothetical protein
MNTETISAEGQLVTVVYLWIMVFGGLLYNTTNGNSSPKSYVFTLISACGTGGITLLFITGSYWIASIPLFYCVWWFMYQIFAEMKELLGGWWGSYWTARNLYKNSLK